MNADRKLFRRGRLLGACALLAIMLTTSCGNKATEPAEAEEPSRQISVEAEEIAPEELARNVSGTVAGHDYVDLGLSVKWATCNIGARRPEVFGNYYAWGETEPKTSFTQDNSETYGKEMSGDISGNADYDAARANWGGSWRTPTKGEMEEIVRKCSWERATVDGKGGFKVTGPSGKYIFLPAAGVRHGTKAGNVGEDGFYWSSTPGDNMTAHYLGFNLENPYDFGWTIRSGGRSIRPVTK